MGISVAPRELSPLSPSSATAPMLRRIQHRISMAVAISGSPAHNPDYGTELASSIAEQLSHSWTMPFGITTTCCLRGRHLLFFM